jgi:hypothetical protein
MIRGIFLRARRSRHQVRVRFSAATRQSRRGRAYSMRQTYSLKPVCLPAIQTSDSTAFVALKKWTFQLNLVTFEGF